MNKTITILATLFLGCGVAGAIDINPFTSLGVGTNPFASTNKVILPPTPACPTSDEVLQITKPLDPKDPAIVGKNFTIAGNDWHIIVLDSVNPASKTAGGLIVDASRSGNRSICTYTYATDSEYVYVKLISV